jgi:hypothetical protein
MVTYYNESAEFKRMPLCREKTELAISRLENPYNILIKDAEMYQNYLSKNAYKTVGDFILTNSLTRLPKLVKYRVIKESNIIKFIDFARENKKMDPLSYLMNVTNLFRFHKKEMDIAKKITEPKQQKFPDESCKVGDIIWLGQIPIPWQILESKDGLLLLISKFVLECNEYHSIFESVCWQDSYRRKNLNENLYNCIFSEYEKRLIATVDFDRTGNEILIRDDKSGKDHLFFLSLSEAYKYFKTDEDRRARLTAKARQKVMWTFFDEYAAWWLRTPAVGPMQQNIVKKDLDYYKNLEKDFRGEIGRSHVLVDGSIFTHGGIIRSNGYDKYYEYYGVRPAMYIKVS